MSRNGSFALRGWDYKLFVLCVERLIPELVCCFQNPLASASADSGRAPSKPRQIGQKAFQKRVPCHLLDRLISLLGREGEL